MKIKPEQVLPLVPSSMAGNPDSPWIDDGWENPRQRIRRKRPDKGSARRRSDRFRHDHPRKRRRV